MANALDYIKWRGDLSFSASPLNEVDMFVFSQLAMPDYSGIVEAGNRVRIKDVSAGYFESHNEDFRNLGILQSDSVLPMLKALASVPRYKDLYISNYVSKIHAEKEEQFSALSVENPGEFLCVIFRGTDDTIIGWKEDFNIAAKEYVPAQLDATRYLNDAVRNFEKGSVYVCGHSKGGNLAIYSTVAADEEVRKRITGTISFDGPGFRDSFFEMEGYKSVKNRLATVYSENAIIGLLMRTAGKTYIVKTKAFGIQAHDGFNWEIMGPRFVKCSRLSLASQKFNAVIDETMENMDEAARLALIDELFDALFSTGAKTITELSRTSLKTKTDLILKLTKEKNLTSFAKVILESFLNFQPQQKNISE